jgi:predicted transcriptional regulator
MLEITETDPKKVDPHLTTKIVGSYVRHHTVGADQVSELITSVHGALSQLGRPNQPEEALTPAVPVRQSVRHDYVVCLDCGYRAKMLRRHISKLHGLSRDEYLKRWGLRRDHPLTAPGYSEQRSSAAKELRLGHKIKAKARPATVSTGNDAKPTRRRNTRSASRTEVASKAAAEAPMRPRQSHSKNSPAAA